MSKDKVAAYTMETVTAVRNNDIVKVRELYASGKNLECCNRFGETIFHFACRRGFTEIVEFFMTTANVAHRVVCNSGRTPMHDACWTGTPNFECIRQVLQSTPDLLLISDKRGFSPLAYVPRDTLGEWSTFLEESRDILVPKILR